MIKDHAVVLLLYLNFLWREERLFSFIFSSVTCLVSCALVSQNMLLMLKITKFITVRWKPTAVFTLPLHRLKPSLYVWSSDSFFWAHMSQSQPQTKRDSAGVDTINPPPWIMFCFYKDNGWMLCKEMHSGLFPTWQEGKIQNYKTACMHLLSVWVEADSWASAVSGRGSKG